MSTNNTRHVVKVVERFSLIVHETIETGDRMEAEQLKRGLEINLNHDDFKVTIEEITE